MFTQFLAEGSNLVPVKEEGVLEILSHKIRVMVLEV